jgi:hypothetical protein
MDEEEHGEGVPASTETKPKLETKPSPIKRSDSPTKKVIKRASPNEKQPPKKRQKKVKSLSRDDIGELSTDDSVTSDFKDLDAGDAPKRKRDTKSKPRTRVKRQLKKNAKVESDESDEDNISEPSFVDSNEDSEATQSPPKKSKREAGSRRGSQKSKIESDEASEEEQKDIKASQTNTGTQSTSTKVEDTDEKSDMIDEGSDSEADMMIDERPKPKQKRRFNSEASSSSKSAKSKATHKDLSPEEAQIKTLQSQLTKCGVRKIWGIELKKYGDDSQKKIRHLQGMLRDVGMTGRFSEQRAREIKELRELQADLEAVTEGDSKWGLQSGKRVRAQRKSLREISEDDENEDEDDFGEVDRKFNMEGTVDEKSSSKAARAKQELAFLGDEESDSD